MYGNDLEHPPEARNVAHPNRSPVRAAAGWLGVVLLVLGLAAMGLVVTPIAVIFGGTVLLAWHPTINVAQGIGLGLTIFGVLSAPLGALYWLITGVYLLGDTRETTDHSRSWGRAVGAYVILILAVIGFVLLDNLLHYWYGSPTTPAIAGGAYSR